MKYPTPEERAITQRYFEETHGASNASYVLPLLALVAAIEAELPPHDSNCSHRVLMGGKCDCANARIHAILRGGV